MRTLIALIALAVALAMTTGCITIVRGGERCDRDCPCPCCASEASGQASAPQTN